MMKMFWIEGFQFLWSMSVAFDLGASSCPTSFILNVLLWLELDNFFHYVVLVMFSIEVGCAIGAQDIFWRSSHCWQNKILM